MNIPINEEHKTIAIGLLLVILFIVFVIGLVNDLAQSKDSEFDFHIHPDDNPDRSPHSKE